MIAQQHSLPNRRYKTRRAVPALGGTIPNYANRRRIRSPPKIPILRLIPLGLLPYRAWLRDRSSRLAIPDNLIYP
jgi:hypothetical protein